MSGDFQELLKHFAELTGKSARFRRVALHVHSPGSYDFGDCSDDKSLNGKSQYIDTGGESRYLGHFYVPTGLPSSKDQSHRKPHFDLVAITDHMKAGYACRLAKAAASFPAVCVLPGIELNVRLQPPLNSLRLHLLAIFPCSQDVDEIGRIFPGDFPGDQKRSGQEVVEVDDLVRFVKKIRECNGLCIAAHVDSDNGIRMLFRQTGKDTLTLFSPDKKLTREKEREISESFKDYLVKARFDGIEVKDPKDRRHYTWITEPEAGTKHYVPVFLTFDAHCIEDLSKQDRATYVKMAEVSWQGLSEAIKFPHTRIRFADERVPPPHVLGIEIVSTEGKGFFPNLQLAFAENLNCIIGPRGSGKSTIVDAFRYVFGYNRTLDQLEVEDLKNAVLQRQEATLKDSIIRVGYRTETHEIHFLEATYDSKSEYTTKVYDAYGNPIPVSDVEKSGHYPLRLFGWSEIETLGRDPARQRDLLDKLVQGLANHQEMQRELRRQLVSNSRSITFEGQKLVEILDRDDGEIKHYSSYHQEFEQLNTPEVQKLFVDLDQERERLGFLQKLHLAIQDLSDRIRETIPVSIDDLPGDRSDMGNRFLFALDGNLEKMLTPGSLLESWWRERAEAIRFGEIQQSIVNELRQLVRTVDQLSSRIDALGRETGQRIDEIEREIHNKVSADTTKQRLADLRTEAKKRLDRTESLREEYNGALRGIEGLLEVRQRTIDELNDCHKAISGLRMSKKTEIEEQLNEFQTEDMVISIDFARDGDRSTFLEYLSSQGFLHDVHTQYRFRKLPDLLTAACTPIQLARCVFDQSSEPLIYSAEVDGKEFAINADYATKIIQGLSPFGWDDQAEVKTLNLQNLRTLLEIQEIEWDDNERILRNNQPVDVSSPGQRSSAMLPLIALAERVPLLIDQPEDNLDNRLVGQMLVEILTRLKERRQIIVATHNPNIVVLGDAEQVAVLDAVSDAEGKVEEPQASVDDPFIVSRIIELLEGGAEAFKTRRKRYFGRVEDAE